jgi:hypothetical protein
VELGDETTVGGTTSFIVETISGTVLDSSV